MRFATEKQRRSAVLKVMCLSLMMVVSAVASLNVALADIARETGATQTQLQWIVDAYALCFAALLLPAGAIGDHLGRRPVLMFGLSLFGAAAALALAFHSPTELLVLRMLMGVGAAFVMPVTLSVITTVFPADERGKAVGTWVGVAAGGGVLGLLSSGLLLEWLPWSSIFVLNIVMAALALFGTIAVVPATRDDDPPSLDPVGTALSVAGLAAIVFGIIEGPERGWADPVTGASLAAGALALIAFVRWELNRSAPMLDPRNFLRRGFGAGSLSITVQFFAAFGFMFIAMPYLQLVLGFSPLKAAAGLLPMAVVVMPLSRVAPSIAARVGVRITGAAGLSLMATGFVVMATADAGSSYWHFVAGLLPFGAGMALSGAPATTAIVASLPPEKQGVASAVNDLSRELGGALGIAVLGSVLNTAYRADLHDAAAGLPSDLAHKATSSLAAAQQLGVKGAEAAFMHGLSASLFAGAAALVLGAIFVAVRAPGRAESRANAGVKALAATHEPLMSVS